MSTRNIGSSSRLMIHKFVIKFSSGYASANTEPQLLDVNTYIPNHLTVLNQCRVAEEVIFGEDNVTTGASNDFMQVSRVARQMVERFGFSKKIGQVAIGGPGGNPFLGQQVWLLVLISVRPSTVLQNQGNNDNSGLRCLYFDCRCHHRRITQWPLQMWWMQRLGSSWKQHMRGRRRSSRPTLTSSTSLLNS